MPQRPHRRLIRNIILIVLGLAACSGILYVAGLMLLVNAVEGLGNTFDSPMCKSNPSGVESIAHIKLPRSAVPVYSSCGGMQGIWAEVHFDMNPSDLETFIRSTNVELPLATTGKPDKPECLCPDMRDVTAYLYGTYSAPEWYEEILIDTRDSDRWRVYFTLLAG